VALKRLLPLDGEQKKQREANKSAVNDLLREASILSAMQHPNIVAVFDAGVDEIWAYVVMELIEGEILRNAVERGPLVEEDFVLVAEQTLDALISAHHHGLLHRDIKPLNLMFRWLPSDSFQVKLLDFGLAKFSTEPSKQTEAFKDTIMGSSAYMAPEQFERKLLDPRADLYQLGSVYYYALTAMLPFDGETPAEVMESHLQHCDTPLQELRTDLPPALCDWVMKLSECVPDDRPTTAKEALKTFRHAIKTNATLDDEDTTPVVIGGNPTSAESPSFMLEEEELTKGSVGKLIGWCVALVGVAALAYVYIREATLSEVVPVEDPFAMAEDDVPVILVEDQAKLKVALDQVVNVRGQVVHTGQSRGGTSFLNFNEPHFGVVSFPSDRAFFRLDPAMLYKDKLIEITGTIEQYEDQFQIKLSHPDQVKVLE
jgi:DNA/RNA endonuclease YhcR with UshA esterase domain